MNWIDDDHRTKYDARVSRPTYALYEYIKRQNQRRRWDFPDRLVEISSAMIDAVADVRKQLGPEIPPYVESLSMIRPFGYSNDPLKKKTTNGPISADAAFLEECEAASAYIRYKTTSTHTRLGCDVLEKIEYVVGVTDDDVLPRDDDQWWAAALYADIVYGLQHVLAYTLMEAPENTKLYATFRSLYAKIHTAFGVFVWSDLMEWRLVELYEPFVLDQDAKGLLKKTGKLMTRQAVNKNYMLSHVQNKANATLPLFRMYERRKETRTVNAMRMWTPEKHNDEQGVQLAGIPEGIFTKMIMQICAMNLDGVDILSFFDRCAVTDQEFPDKLGRKLLIVMNHSGLMEAADAGNVATIPIRLQATDAQEKMLIMNQAITRAMIEVKKKDGTATKDDDGKISVVDENTLLMSMMSTLTTSTTTTICKS